ncbi:MAG TPA: hypothetical protein PKX91_03175 [Clostridia bacterium]|jgi:tetratricopeptide (TPR) repeat protein|nr:hypothetical protein [Clostridia bacterium]
MSKTDYRCDDCGTPLYLDAGGKSATCPKCGRKEVYVEDLKGNDDKVFPIQVNKDNTEYIAKGEAFLEVQDYASAFESFAKAINLDPNDYRGWWGTCRCRLLDNYLCEDNGYSRDFKKVIMLAPEYAKKELEAKYEVYLAKLEEKRDAKEKEKERTQKLYSGEILNVNANYGPRKTFMLDMFLIGILVILCPLAATLAAFVPAYRLAGILLGVMFIIGAVFLAIELKRKYTIVKKVENREIRTVSELMAMFKKKKKPEVQKVLKDMISAGYILGYEIIDGEQIAKVQDYDRVKEKKEKTKTL